MKKIKLCKRKIVSILLSVLMLATLFPGKICVATDIASSEKVENNNGKVLNQYYKLTIEGNRFIKDISCYAAPYRPDRQRNKYIYKPELEKLPLLYILAIILTVMRI